MVEGSPDDGNFLVRVRAQVMTRDEYGWVPMGGGGLSNVSVRKRVEDTPDRKPDYVICGKRISDQTVVLSCTIKKDFQYNKVMPTFHHWRTGDKKFGLTFQTAADARAFDKGVRTAVEDLLEGVGCGQNMLDDDDLEDNEVFMALDLPNHSSSSENGNGGCRPPSATPSPADTFFNSSPRSQHLYRVHYMKPSHTMPTAGTVGSVVGTLPTSISVGQGELQHGITPQKIQDTDPWSKDKPTDQIELSTLGSYSYVQFSKDRARGKSPTEPVYHYPSIESIKPGRPEDFKKPTPVAAEPPLLPVKGKNTTTNRRQTSPSTDQRCRLCLDTFTEEDNRPGACRYGHDRTLSCINHATCFSCSQCMLYHCMSDAEGDFHHHPCSCDTSDGRCGRRWTGLAVLSLFVPCLWCYLPLRACHRCGVGCSYCGGRHEPE